MKKIILSYSLVTLALSSGCANWGSSSTTAKTTVATAVVSAQKTASVSASNLAAFPLAEEGYQRHVFSLPRLADESSHFVTLVLGRKVLTDPVNNYRMLGTLTAVTVEGWGYTYYQLESDGEMAGTLMAVPPSEPQVERFITVNTQLQPIRYNSKLPVVVIVPEGFEVRYQIWSAGELQVAPEG